MEINNKKEQLTDIERIQFIAEVNNLTLNAFARSLGYKNAQIFYDIRKGKHRISRELANKIHEKYLNFDVPWILTGNCESKTINSNKTKEESQNDAEIVKELIEAIKRRDKHVEALIRISEKHADNFAELLNQMKKTTAHPNKDAACTDTSELSEE